MTRIYNIGRGEKREFLLSKSKGLQPNSKEKKNMLVINGFEIQLTQGEDGHQSVWVWDDGWYKCGVFENRKGYMQVQFPKWTGIKVTMLHKLVYAYCMNWGRLDIMPKQHIHHLDKNTLNNTIENLICIPEAMHHRLHSALNKMASPKDPDEFYAAQAEASSIINKGVAIRDNRIKKCGRVPGPIGSLIEFDENDPMIELKLMKLFPKYHKTRRKSVTEEQDKFIGKDEE